MGNAKSFHLVSRGFSPLGWAGVGFECFCYTTGCVPLYFKWSQLINQMAQHAHPGVIGQLCWRGSQGWVTKVSPRSCWGSLVQVPDLAGIGCQAFQDLAARAGGDEGCTLKGRSDYFF